MDWIQVITTSWMPSVSTMLITIGVVLTAAKWMVSRIDQQGIRIDQQGIRIDQQGARTDKLYEMFVDLLKENRKK